MEGKEGRPIRVAIVDDEPVTREGVARTLDEAFPVEVLLSSATYPDLPSVLHGLAPDVIVVDYDLASVQEADSLTQLKEACPESGIILFTNDDRRESVLQAIALGASGYVLKTAGKEDLCRAVSSALSGSWFGSLELTPKVMWELVSRVRAMQNHARSAGLSNREREILVLMVQGHTTEEIAAELFLSVHTIRTYRQRMMQKLGTRNWPELVVHALSHGMVELPVAPGNGPNRRAEFGPVHNP